VNKQVADLYQPLHPVILKMIRTVVQAAKDAGIEVALCGEMGADPINLPVLLGLGLDSISMNPISIPAIKSLVRSLSYQDCQSVTKDALTQANAADVQRLILDNYADLLDMATFFQSNGNGSAVELP
jgi:phosphotransferase system enzyme I (PtsI)